MNIFGLYISFSQSEKKSFEKTLQKVIEYQNGNHIVIIHFVFDHDDKIDHIRNVSKKIPCELILIKDNNCIRLDTYIHSIKDIIGLYKVLNSSNHFPNIFIYSGHSDGLILGHKRIYFLSMDDFAEIIMGVLHKKCDLVWCDTCLSGNISSLNSLKDVTRYFIASPMYYNYDSVLELKNLYRYPDQKRNTRMISYGKRIINEYMKIQRKKFTSTNFMVNIVFYEMNRYVSKLIDIILQNKNKIEYNICSISKSDYYYIDILCSLKQLDFKLYNKVKKYLDQIIVYKKQLDLGNNLDSKLLIILREPYLYFDYDNDLFFKSNEI
jgi:hypothetical protein